MRETQQERLTVCNWKKKLKNQKTLKIPFWNKMFHHSNALLCTLTSEIKHLITAMAEMYGVSFYNIMHENDFKIKNTLWSNFSKILIA